MWNLHLAELRQCYVESWDCVSQTSDREHKWPRAPDAALSSIWVFVQRPCLPRLLPANAWAGSSAEAERFLGDRVPSSSDCWCGLKTLLCDGFGDWTFLILHRSLETSTHLPSLPLTFTWGQICIGLRQSYSPSPDSLPIFFHRRFLQGPPHNLGIKLKCGTLCSKLLRISTVCAYGSACLHALDYSLFFFLN